MAQDVKSASGHGFLKLSLIQAKRASTFFRAKISTPGKFSRSCAIPTPRGDASRDRKIFPSAVGLGMLQTDGRIVLLLLHLQHFTRRLDYIIGCEAEIFE